MIRRSLLLAASLLATSAATGAGPAGFAGLSQAFRAAHEAGDIEAMSGLVCWDRVDARTRGSVRKHVAADFGLKIDRLEFEPIAETDLLEYELGGVLYRPNLRPVGWLVVHFAGAPVPGEVQVTNTKYLIGRKGDELRITTAAPVAP